MEVLEVAYRRQDWSVAEHVADGHENVEEDVDVDEGEEVLGHVVVDLVG